MLCPELRSPSLIGKVGREATIRLERDQEFADSLVEEAGFELLVPLTLNARC